MSEPIADLPRRLTPTERLHEVTMATLTRQPRSGQQSVEVGESAQGVAYVKSIQVYQGEEEGWASMCKRAADMLIYTRGMLRPETNGTPDDSGEVPF